MVKVAVLLASYNGEKFIERQIQSIMGQKGNFEVDIFVRDDGSQDSTCNILSRLENEGVITLIPGCGKIGPARVFYSLLMEVEGYDYYAFSDQDDVWDTSRIENGIKGLEGHFLPAIFFSNGTIVDENLMPLGRNVHIHCPPTDFKSVICGSSVQGCTMLFNDKLASVVREKGEPTKMSLHDSFLARTCVSIGGEIIYSDKALIKYRQHAKNTIGFPVSKVNVIKARLKMIFTHDQIGIAEDAYEIINKYCDYISFDSLKFLLKVSNYKKNSMSRLLLAIDPTVHYVSFNMSLGMRLKILIGNA